MTRRMSFHGAGMLRGVVQPTLYMSVGLADAFVSQARYNTEHNIETIGILAGKRSADGSFKCKTCVIPDQRGDAGQCALTSEGNIQLVEVLEGNEDIAIGWIHTHPKHGLFLSSVDLHNQLKFQRELQGSVAGVYSGMYCLFTSNILLFISHIKT